MLGPARTQADAYLRFTLWRLCRRRRGQYFIMPSLRPSGMPPLVFTLVR